jgi:hypothetical protein
MLEIKSPVDKSHGARYSTSTNNDAIKGKIVLHVVLGRWGGAKLLVWASPPSRKALLGTRAITDTYYVVRYRLILQIVSARICGRGLTMLLRSG